MDRRKKFLPDGQTDFYFGETSQVVQKKWVSLKDRLTRGLLYR
jgi:hypothetical protein